MIALLAALTFLAAGAWLWWWSMQTRQAEEEPQAEAEPQAKVEPRAEAEPPAKAEPQAEAEPQAKAEPRVEVEPQAKVEPGAEVEPQAEAEPQCEILQTTNSSEPRAVPNYAGIAPARAKQGGKRESNKRDTDRQSNQPASTAPADLHLKLAFDRHGAIRSAALIPDRRTGMPDEVLISSSLGEFKLTHLDDRRFDEVEVSDLGRLLSEGAEFRAIGATANLRWLLTRRPLFVLAPGESFGVCGHISVPKLLLGVEHTLLISEDLIESALAVLSQAGCSSAGIDVAAAQPVRGWRLLRGVTPTRSVPATGERDSLNALCPVADVCAQFTRGIRVRTRDWLIGFPPRIRFTGALPENFCVLIDETPAHAAADGAFEVPGWDAEGEHRLWFADQAENYRVVRAAENWAAWEAHDFGLDGAVCGAAVHCTGNRTAHLMVQASNPLLIGATPGEIFLCPQRSDVRTDRIFASIPFEPVWAFPTDSAHCDKRSARIVLMGRAVPPAGTRVPPSGRKQCASIQQWCSVINDAGRKGLKLATTSDDAVKTWTAYRRLARALHRAMR